MGISTTPLTDQQERQGASAIAGLRLLGALHLSLVSTEQRDGTAEQRSRSREKLEIDVDMTC